MGLLASDGITGRGSLTSNRLDLLERAAVGLILVKTRDG